VRWSCEEAAATGLAVSELLIATRAGCADSTSKVGWYMRRCKARVSARCAQYGCGRTVCLGVAALRSRSVHAARRFTRRGGDRVPRSRSQRRQRRSDQPAGVQRPRRHKGTSPNDGTTTDAGIPNTPSNGMWRRSCARSRRALQHFGAMSGGNDFSSLRGSSPSNNRLWAKQFS